jgi:site-specific recombinase XerD
MSTKQRVDGPKRRGTVKAQSDAGLAEVARAAQQAGIAKRVYPHLLRHSIATDPLN